MRKNLGFLFLFLGIGLVISVLYINSSFRTKTVPFSRYTILSSSWDKYKQKFINNDGRVIDPTQDDSTTSEGQSYALLRSVWMDDRETFDTVWTWTNQTLKRPTDNLFSWKWGKRSDGTYGVYPQGGINSASDADSDIAFALILAGNRWKDKKYISSAKRILADIWRLETVMVGGKRYLIAGNWAQDQQQIIINPSYFSPYAWRVFTKADTARPWQSLISPGYKLLMQSAMSPLDKGKGVGLIPDWLRMERSSGEFMASSLPNLTTNYSYDALRIPWRIGLDYQVNKDPKAKEFLLISCKRLAEDFSKNKTLVDSYSHSGERIGKGESPSMYAAALGCMEVINSDLASQMYQKKILGVYSNAESSFREDLPYYEQNWLWFGTALYHKFLIIY